MLANFQERVDLLARMIVLSDAGDLTGLVAIQEQASVLAGDLVADHSEALADVAKKVGSLAEAIVMASAADTNKTFAEIGAMVEKLQKAATEPEVESTANTNSAGDKELIAAWISSCDSMLTELEGRLLVLEKSPTDAEVIADIRRTMHTLKGECGVLSQHEAQKLFHEAESLIDLCVQVGEPLPIDPFLTLLDWMRGFTTKLAADHNAKPDSSADLLATIIAAQTTFSAQNESKPSVPSQSASVAPVSQQPVAHQTVVAAAPTAPKQEEAPVAAKQATTPPTATRTSTITPIVDDTPVQFAAQEGSEENLPDFLCEAKDHIANSEEALLALDQDRANKELINTVFRAFHTIKGVSGFMALKPIVSLAHSAEQLLDGARSGTIALGRGELDLILSSCDMMTKLLAVLEGSKGPSRGDFETLVMRLNEASAGGGVPNAAPQTAQAPIAPAQPVAAAAPVETKKSADTQPSSVSPTQSSTPVVESKPPQREIPAAETPKAASDGDHGASKLKKSEQTVKVNTTRMDSLVTMVGELVIAQQMVVQDMNAVISGTLGADGGQRAQRTLSHMGKMIRELQEVSMSLRMVNLKSTFQKMTRLVRDVSQKAGKQIEIVTEGEDVELDRNVVEAITDPLVHMIRNSCDHGVEGAEERVASGKNPVGTVTLRAYHAGGSIVIEIADDGRGLKREKLIAKAKSKGIIPQDTDEASMPDGDVFALIFLPGFSTAEKVTDISGRGVGMDVVRRNIEALRGKIEIRSTPGKGTTFLLRLPLTMAIIDGMVVRVGEQRYVLPTLSIQQSFCPKAEDVRTAVGVGEMVNVRGSMLPIYRLNRVLDLHAGRDNITDALLIVMESDDQRFCLMVDEIIGQQQVVIKTLNQTGQKLRGVSGGAILGDGRVALILDVAQIASIARECDAVQTTFKQTTHETLLAQAGTLASVS
ncbi:MAG: chemotaxis protein CheW [Phycisphaerales bacterium]